MALTKTNLANIVEGVLPVANGGTGSTSLSGANLAVTNATNTFTVDQSISGLTVGMGSGSINSNTTLGRLALAANTTGYFNTALGQGALQANTTGNQNTALGIAALNANLTGSANTAIGDRALQFNTGSNNTSVGSVALYTNTSGQYNTALGQSALFANTTASNNTAVGYQSLYSQTTGGAENTAIGYQAGYSNTGQTLCAIGSGAAYSNTTGADNTAIGSYRPLYSNTTGSNNVAIGRQALQANTTASYNTAVGYQAGYSTTTGTGRNTLIGYYSGYSLTTGNDNTFVGVGAGNNMTTGSKNTIIGEYSGNNSGLDIRTASNYIVLSDGDGNPRGVFDNTGAFLVNATSQSFTAGAIQLEPQGGGSNIPQLAVCGAASSGGNGFTQYSTTASAYRFYVDWAGAIHATSTSIIAISDQTLKTNVKPLETGLAEVMALKPSRFDFINGDATNKAGFIAQEVEQVLPDLVKPYKYSVDENGDDVMKKGLSMGDMVPTLVKAIQELKAEVTALEAQLASKL